MATTEEPNSTRELVETKLLPARQSIVRQMAVIAGAEKILSLLLADILERHTCLSCSNEWVQLSCLDREQVETSMRSLSAGKWEPKPSSNGGMLDYEMEMFGVRVLIYAAPPPGSCRVVEDLVEVPAHTVTERRLICH